MTRVRFTARAREDLLDIWLHVAARNSQTVADRVFERIDRTCRLLRDHPHLGPARPEIHVDAHSLVIDRWLALYRVTEDGVQIVRIIDGARDLLAIEWKPE